MTKWQQIKHNWGMCPKHKAGYNCKGKVYKNGRTECGW